MGYSNSLVHTKHKNYETVIIYLKDGRIIEVSEYTLKSIDQLKKYLNDSSIKSLGYEFTIFPFNKWKYKYSNIVQQVA